jgi:uncharacterized protein YdhG (YjbR/CyaY superfamily)
MKTIKPTSIDEYISAFPDDVQKKLQEVREAIQQAAPNAKEVISYSMPAFKMKGILVYFAAFSQHIGFYPTASGIAAFQDEISIYKNAKGSVQFPLNKPIPLSLIRKIVKFRVKEDYEKYMH